MSKVFTIHNIEKISGKMGFVYEYEGVLFFKEAGGLEPPVPMAKPVDAPLPVNGRIGTLTYEDGVFGLTPEEA